MPSVPAGCPTDRGTEGQATFLSRDHLPDLLPHKKTYINLAYLLKRPPKSLIHPIGITFWFLNKDLPKKKRSAW